MKDRKELVKVYADAIDGSKWVDIDGTQVHYRFHQHTDSKKPVLVLIHGILDSLHTWDSWLPFLKHDFNVLTFDVPGFAFTYPVRINRYERYTYAHFLKELLASLGISQQVFIAGNSLGGFIGWSFSYCFPEQVRGLFLTSPAAYPLRVPPIPIIVANLPLLSKISEKVLNRRLYDRIAKKIYANPDLFPEENLERGFDLISMKGASVHYNKVFKEMSYFLSGYPHEVSDLAAPTMVVWGDSDRLIPTKQMKLWKRDNPNLEYRTIENCGHIPHGERPQKSAKLLLSFFDSL